MTDLEAAIRRIVREEIAEALKAATRPETVSQRTVERWTSLPGRDYLAAARAGAFPVSKVKRLVMARTADVSSWIEIHRKAEPVDEEDATRRAIESVGGRYVK